MTLTPVLHLEQVNDRPILHGSEDWPRVVAGHCRFLSAIEVEASLVGAEMALVPMAWCRRVRETCSASEMPTLRRREASAGRPLENQVVGAKWLAKSQPRMDWDIGRVGNGFPSSGCPKMTKEIWLLLETAPRYSAWTL